MCRLVGAMAVAWALGGCTTFELPPLQLPAPSTSSGDGPLAFLNPFATKEQPVQDTVPAGRLYNEGLVLLNQKRWKAASLRFEEVDRSHPHSELAKKALLMIAYANYQAGDYELAASAADRYITLHPGSEEAAYAKFLMGDSYFRQIPDVARDQTGAERALVALQDVVQRHPGTEYAKAAERRITIARDQLAGKEMDIGRFYLRQKAFGAAAGRFKTVIQQYQTTRHAEEALYRLVECYVALGVIEEAQTAAAVLGHNFPDSQWYKDAYTLLQTGGVSPQENENSWISKAFKGFVNLVR